MAGLGAGSREPRGETIKVEHRKVAMEKETEGDRIKRDEECTKHNG